MSHPEKVYDFAVWRSVSPHLSTCFPVAAGCCFHQYISNKSKVNDMSNKVIALLEHFAVLGVNLHFTCVCSVVTWEHNDIVIPQYVCRCFPIMLLLKATPLHNTWFQLQVLGSWNAQWRTSIFYARYYQFIENKCHFHMLFLPPSTPPREPPPHRMWDLIPSNRLRFPSKARPTHAPAYDEARDAPV